MDRATEVYEVVKNIPFGKVASYGYVGKNLSSPLSGLLVGRIMRSAPEGVPWWRVVAHDGAIVTGKLDPRIALEQRRQLEAEGVAFNGENVEPIHFVRDLL